MELLNVRVQDAVSNDLPKRQDAKQRADGNASVIVKVCLNFFFIPLQFNYIMHLNLQLDILQSMKFAQNEIQIYARYDHRLNM